MGVVPIFLPSMVTSASWGLVSIEITHGKCDTASSLLKLILLAWSPFTSIVIDSGL